MMKKILLLLLLAGPLMAVQGWAADDGKMLLVYYRDASGLQRLDVFPESMLTDWKDVQGQWRVSTVADTAFCYNDARVDSVVVRTKAEVGNRLASIVQLKFNNKYNDQVYTDVVADITGDSLITARVAGIGKWLTPSVQFSNDSARLYVGRELQLNKQSRRKFDKDVIYTVALPRQRCYEQVLVKEAVWDGETEQYVETPVELDASMFSGNLPGRDGEGWAQMLDGDVNTFYHSTWDVPQEEKETIYNTEPYIEIALPEELSRLRFGYTTRNNDGYAPLKLTLYASKDGKSWKNIRSFTADEDGLPTGAGQTYESQQVDLGSSYKYLRLRLMESQRHRYLVFSEFRLWRVTENPDYHGSEEVEPAEYAYEMVPFGRNYRVHVDWLTDKATQVPRIDINIENGEMVSSKDYYLNADITIDGAGVFPSMGHTAVQIKGRGNSSWNGWWPYDKNPYRLKFSEKIKPFGLTKGKNWVLLANKQTGSMTSNAIGMKAACLVGTAGANHMVPVELYINGEYRGSYNFTEKVGLANNSIDLADESAATLLELDTYYDEAYKFRSQPYNLPVNIKEPEFDEAGIQRLHVGPEEGSGRGRPRRHRDAGTLPDGERPHCQLRAAASEEHVPLQRVCGQQRQQVRVRPRVGPRLGLRLRARKELFPERRVGQLLDYDNGDGVAPVHLRPTLRQQGARQGLLPAVDALPRPAARRTHRFLRRLLRLCASVAGEQCHPLGRRQKLRPIDGAGQGVAAPPCRLHLQPTDGLRTGSRRGAR